VELQYAMLNANATPKVNSLTFLNPHHGFRNLLLICVNLIIVDWIILLLLLLLGWMSCSLRRIFE
jgi:hypothetical protein